MAPKKHSTPTRAEKEVTRKGRNSLFEAARKLAGNSTNVCLVIRSSDKNHIFTSISDIGRSLSIDDIVRNLPFFVLTTDHGSEANNSMVIQSVPQTEDCREKEVNAEVRCSNDIFLDFNPRSRSIIDERYKNQFVVEKESISYSLTDGKRYTWRCRMAVNLIQILKYKILTCFPSHSVARLHSLDML